MRRIILHIIFICLIIAPQAIAQTVPWNTSTITTVSSVLNIANSPKINSVALQTGDYIGVFDSLDNCYGIGKWQDTTELKINITGSDGTNKGFKVGQKLYFKVWLYAEDCIIEKVTQLSSDSELVFSTSKSNRVISLQFERSSITYPLAECCVSASPLSPVINYQPDGLTFNSADGLSVNPTTGYIQPKKSLPGTYTITFTTNKICLTQKTATLTLNDIPRFAPVPDTLICNDNITVSAPSGYPNALWNTGQRAANIEISEPGTHWFTVTNDKGCSNSDTFTVKKTSLDRFNYLTFPADCYNKAKLEVTSQVISNGRTPYTYRLKNIIDNSVTTDIANIPEGIYSATIINSNGCEMNYFEKIKFEKDCLNDIPVFTPNSDGLDDRYFISLEGKIKIFDRNGKLRRTLDGPVYFDGNDENNKPLPMGTYLVVADSGKTVTLTIVR